MYLPEIMLNVGKFMEIETSAFPFLFIYLMRILFAFDFDGGQVNVVSECMCECFCVCNQKPVRGAREWEVGSWAWQLARRPLNGKDISPGAAVLMRSASCSVCR